MITAYNYAGETLNTCQKCGTVNYFDAEISALYQNAYCYHCGELVQVPETARYKYTPTKLFISDHYKMRKWRFRE